jgi:two-component system, sensor histidine kinase and response regulator
MDASARILIIDDEEIVLDSCKRILRGSEYELATAADGTIGLELLESFRPDVVFVDLMMPGLSGFEVLERIAAIDTTIVAIVITGYATVTSAVDAMKRGAYDFLPKPFTPDEFRLIARRGLERRRLVQETIALRREREVLREQFAAIVSHELKAPLGAVQQNLFVLEMELADSLSAPQLERLARMKAKIDDLIKLIHTWLRVLMVDVAKIRETFAPTDVAVVVQKAVENVSPHATRKNITIVTESGDVGQVMGDEGTLVEALANVLGNAIKYSHDGATVTLRAERVGDGVTIAVSDTGVGISAEDLPYVFGDFFRAESGRSAAEGAGLGLSITRRIIEAHDGTVSAHSEVGRGSTFTFRLPALSGAVPEGTGRSVGAEAPAQQGGRQ